MQKQRLYRVLLMLVCLGLLAGTSLMQVTAQDEPYKFAIIVHDGTTSFYAPVINGMNIACEQLGAECQFIGPPNGSDVAAQVDLAENAINSGVDGIILDIPDENAMERGCRSSRSGWCRRLFHRYGVPADDRLRLNWARFLRRRADDGQPNRQLLA